MVAEMSFEVGEVGGICLNLNQQNNMCELQKKKKKILGHNDLVLLICTVVMLKTCNIA